MVDEQADSPSAAMTSQHDKFTAAHTSNPHTSTIRLPSDAMNSSDLILAKSRETPKDMATMSQPNDIRYAPLWPTGIKSEGNALITSTSQVSRGAVKDGLVPERLPPRMPSLSELCASPHDQTQIESAEAIGGQLTINGREAEEHALSSHDSQGPNSSLDDSVKMEAPEDQGSTAQPHGKKRKGGGGRPRNPTPKRSKQKGPTKLRKGREVVAAVPMDVWQLVLSYCPPTFLGRAQRINRSFQDALSYESAWTMNRIQNYGEDMPGPLPGLKEWEYVNLIEGMGCMGCGNKKTRKCHWAFLTRLCKVCFAKDIIRESAVQEIENSIDGRILECIPHAVLDSWGNYEGAGYTSRVISKPGHGRSKAWLKSDVTAIVKEFEGFLQCAEEGQVRSEEERRNWIDAKADATTKRMEHTEKIEDWLEEESQSRKLALLARRNQRIEFYKQKAMTLVPPMDEATLAFIPAYKRAIEIAKTPNDRSWRALLPKLLEKRSEAEWLSGSNLTPAQLKELQDKREQYQKILQSRKGCTTTEQQFVLKLAKDVLSEFAAARLLDPVDDADYGLLFLQAVRAKYYGLSAVEKPWAQGSSGPYCLLLDDARMVYDKILCPHISGFMSSSRLRAAKSYKCPGCTRTDVHVRFSFEQLFAHISARHAPDLTDYRVFHTKTVSAGERVPWCIVEWPKHLPVLAEHHDRNGRWDPDDVTPYVRAPTTDPAMQQVIPAFEGRTVSTPTQNGPEGSKFTENVLYAANLLEKTGLSSEQISQVAFKYGVERYKESKKADVQYAQISDLAVALVRGGHHELFSKVRCGICKISDHVRPPKFAIRDHSFGDLIRHFLREHDGLFWSDKFIFMPSETALYHDLVSAGLERYDGQLTAFDQLFPSTHPAGQNRPITQPRAISSNLDSSGWLHLDSGRQDGGGGDDDPTQQA
ncbi:MAG: hypothetical protein M1819_002761 [Sarea resinae]|nr:MAG: hypothetical protein M1819_002761 [Sarea resinae]